MSKILQTYTFPLSTGSGTLKITDELSCTGEDYIGTPQVYGTCVLNQGASYYSNLEIRGFNEQSAQPNALRAFWVDDSVEFTDKPWVKINSDFNISGLAEQTLRVYEVGSYTMFDNQPWFFVPSMSYPYVKNINVVFASNMPIFDTKAHAIAYLSENNAVARVNMIKLYAVNYDAGEVEDTKEFFYYGYAHNYTVDEYGNYSENNEPVLYKGFRVKSTGRVSLYVVDGINDGNLKLRINMSDVQIAYYSYDGETWQNQQGSPTTLPFDFVWRKWNKEIGTFYCSGSIRQKPRIYGKNFRCHDT